MAKRLLDAVSPDDLESTLGFRAPKNLPAPAGGGRRFQQEECAAGFRVLARSLDMPKEPKADGCFEVFID